MEKGNEILNLENLRFIDEAKMKRKIDETLSARPVSDPIKASLLKFHQVEKFDLKDLK